MRTMRRAVVVLGLLIGLGLAVETRPPVAQASCCGTPTLVGASGSTIWTRHTYTGSVYAALQCTCGGATTFDNLPVGSSAATVQWSGLNTSLTYHIWSCPTGPHTASDCSASLTVGPNTCAGCASASPQDGQIWDDLLHGPVRLGTQWNGSQWFGRPTGARPDKGIGGGGSPCQCPTFYYVTYVNGVPYCKTALPPFNVFPC